MTSMGTENQPPKTADASASLARALIPVLDALLLTGGRLPEPLGTARTRPPELWDLHLAHQVYMVLTSGLADAVERAGFDPDMLPSPANRLLDLFGDQNPDPDVPPQVSLTILDPTADLTALIKTIPGAAWDSAARRWRIVVLKQSIEPLRDLVREQKVLVSPEAADVLRRVATSTGELKIGPAYLGARGRVYVKLTVPIPSIADALKRVPSMSWDAESGAYSAPASRLRDVAIIAEKSGIDLAPEIQAKLDDLDAPLVYDGTLDGLRGVPVTDLACVDEKKAERFAEFGIGTVFDLLLMTPRKYLDRSNLTPISALSEGDEVGLLATITNITVDPRKRIVKIQVADGTGRLPLTYFNAVWQAKRFRVGDEVSIYGKVEAWTGGARKILSITNPVMDPVGDDTLPVIPIYPQSGKSRITTWDLHQAVAEAIRRMGVLADPLPIPIRTKLDLMERQTALKSVHLPTDPEQASIARERLAFDELFRMQAALLLTKASEESETGIAHKPTGEMTKALISSLPFPLTGAQNRVIEQVKESLCAPHPMHLLLQGDVGSGKTLCSMVTLLSGIESGYQGALMAPTEILASQLYAEIVERTEGILTPSGDPLEVVFVTNKLRGKKRVEALQRLAEGKTHIAVGTHALIVGDVTFKNLGVVVVDEQHRFGVEQRAALRAKGPLVDETNPEGEHIRPDMLIMTATPIPRTAAMTVFGDLSIAILDELPPGRTPIVTSWIDQEPSLTSPLADPWPLIRSEVAKGRQAYVVCPLVEESEKMQAASAVETYEDLQYGALAGLRIGLVHGQQKQEERAETMAAFRDGELDVLVATTVIEVGVNVPNATAIVILDSSRFGIAQLHQLRGRVGRGKHASECVLVGRCVSSDSRARMQALCDSTDGFYLSEVDLDLRGHGSVFGTAQSGQSDLRVADLNEDRELLYAAREAAIAVLADDPALARRPALRSEILIVLGSEAQEWLSKS